MYPGMAKTAREEGFNEIADWFETLAKAEKSHAGRFQKMLDLIVLSSSFKPADDDEVRSRRRAGRILVCVPPLAAP